MDEKIKTGKIRILFSSESIEEFLTVANRPKFKNMFSEKEIEAAIDLFDVYAEMHDVKSKIEICRDLKDNFLLALAKDARADYLITGDKDILELKLFGKTRIITISTFLKSMN